MSTRVEADEIHITSSEKTLAVVLAVFMLIGGLWVYSEPLDRTGSQDPFAGPVSRTSPEKTALGRRNDAQASLRRARRTQEQARRNLELRREAYRTELDAGRSGVEAEPATWASRPRRPS